MSEQIFEDDAPEVEPNGDGPHAQADDQDDEPRAASSPPACSFLRRNTGRRTRFGCTCAR
jgi:hypothetical protein